MHNFYCITARACPRDAPGSISFDTVTGMDSTRATARPGASLNRKPRRAVSLPAAPRGLRLAGSGRHGLQAGPRITKGGRMGAELNQGAARVRIIMMRGVTRGVQVALFRAHSGPSCTNKVMHRAVAAPSRQCQSRRPSQSSVPLSVQHASSLTRAGPTSESLQPSFIRVARFITSRARPRPARLPGSAAGYRPTIVRHNLDPSRVYRGSTRVPVSHANLYRPWPWPPALRCAGPGRPVRAIMTSGPSASFPVPAFRVRCQRRRARRFRAHPRPWSDTRAVRRTHGAQSAPPVGPRLRAVPGATARLSPSRRGPSPRRRRPGGC